MLDKLFRAMQAMSNPVKDKTADAGKYKYNYSDLSQVLSIVKPALAKEGLGLWQRVEYDNEHIPYLVTYIFDDKEKMELSRRRIYDFTDAQAVGSGLTYIRRYELLTIFGLAAEDDDGSQTRNASPLPRSLKAAQEMLLKAEAAYCKEHGIADAKQFHQDILCRDDYRNDISSLTKIAMELQSDVG